MLSLCTLIFKTYIMSTITKTTGLLVAQGQVRIKILFPFNPEVLDNIRTLEGREWHPVSKFWSAKLSINNVEALERWGFLTEAVRSYIKSRESGRSTNSVQGLKGTLFPFQLEGVHFINKNNGSGLIADEMGLGKTVQAIAWLHAHPEERPAVIVCPASLKLNWENEIIKWTNIVPHVISGTTPYKLPGNVYIINYDILPKWLPTLQKSFIKTIILDEAHYIKNSQANRTKAVLSLAKTTINRIVLTGTPIESRPSEMFNLIKIVDPHMFGDKWKYMMQYCDAKHNGFGWDFSGASNIPELHKMLTSTIMIRRKKIDVLKDLPDKLYSFVPIALDNRKEYDSAERDFIEYVKKGVELKARKIINAAFTEEFIGIGTINDHKLKELQDEVGLKAEEGGVLYQIEILKQLAANGKLKQTIEWIDNFLESGEKLVIFAHHEFVINALMEHYSKIAVKIDGTVSILNRQIAVNSFQNDKKVKLFIGNLKAAGVGLTLTAASNVALIEYPWTPGELNQAIDRCHRIGQKNTVNVHYLYGIRTIEEKITNLLHSKQKVVDSVLDGKLSENYNLLNELVSSFTNKN